MVSIRKEKVSEARKAFVHKREKFRKLKKRHSYYVYQVTPYILEKGGKK